MFQYLYDQIMGTPPSKKAKTKANRGDDGDLPTQHIAIVMDSSGSMRSMGDEPVQGINHFIDEQKKTTECNIRISVYDFNHAVRELLFNKAIEDIDELPSDFFRPDGMTALRDGIHRAIKDLEILVDSERKYEPVDAPTVIIFTDGVENASRVTQEEIRRLIGQKRELGWKFTFMGCNQDALEVGAKMGVQREQCLTTSSEPATQANIWDAVTRNATRTRSGCDEGFTQCERMASVDTSARSSSATDADNFPRRM